MELFKYNTPTTFSNASPIANWESALWTERFRDPGEFEIKARLSSGLLTALPIGTFISHTKTLEVMIVENHQITEETDEDPLLTITGRSLECILDQRIVGQNRNWASPPASIEASVYNLASNSTWVQARQLIREHSVTGVVTNSSDAIPGIEVEHSVSLTGVNEARVINRGSVHSALMELLSIDELGIKVLRRHAFSGLPGNATNTIFFIYQPTDRRNRVIFSSKTGDIDSADYLWSIKKMKNAALVSGKFIEAFVAGSATGASKRVMLVDGSSIDGHLEAIPTGATLTSLRALMTTKGNAALKEQKKISLSRIDISETPKYEYRTDYDLGDTVSIDASYGKIDSARVIEHVEIVDETGESSHPTIEIIE